VLVVEFWATWCGPCRYSIPHLNQLASALARDVQVIGISNEPVGRIRPFMERNNMNYAVGTDPSQRMYAAMRIQGIPHAIVVSSDGVVRWQGHPLELTEQTLRQIVAADKAARGA
jgi:cytochrome c biogenesis protein CcmG/thiol:disulfide interchange protein DsbE